MKDEIKIKDSGIWAIVIAIFFSSAVIVSAIENINIVCK